MADDIKKINDEINKLRAELSKKPLKPFDEKDLDTAKALLSGLRAEVRELRSDLDYVAKSFRDSVNELSRQNVYLSDARKSLTGISEISRKIVEYRRGENPLSEKQLKNLQQQAKTKFDSLRLDLKSGQLSKQNAKEIKDALKQEDDFNDSIEKTLKYQKQVNREIGLMGTGIKGVSNFLSKMGLGDLSEPINDAIEKTKNARLQMKLNSDEIPKLVNEIQSKNSGNLSSKQLAAGFGGIELKKLQLLKNSLEAQNKELSTQTSKYKNIGESLKNQITSFNLMDFLLIKMAIALINVDKATGDLAKSFNMTYKDASNLREELIQMGNRSGDIAINARALQESMISVGNSLSSNAVLNEKDLITFTKLREQAGFTNEELTEMQKLTFINGGNLEDNVGNLLVAAKTTSLNNKVLLNEKTIMSEVAKTSKAIQLSLGGSGKELGKAVAQVKALGMNMQQVENIAGSLLDFESSISAELEAELLTGKDLNLERARLYAINNDMAGVAREINKQFGSAAEFSHMNRIQQEAAAKAVGMNREELARTLTDQEALRDISADQVGKAQEALNAARDRGMTEEQIREKTIEDLMSQQSIQERLNNTTEKLQEVFVNIAQPLMPLLDSLATVLELVGYILKPLEWMNKLFGMIGEGISKLTGPLGTIGKIMKTIAGVAILTAAYKAYSSLASFPFVGAAMGATASAAILLAGFGVLNKIKDGKIHGKKGLTASGEFGSVQLNEKDKAFWNGQELIAGTDLLGKSKRSSNQNNMQEIKAMRTEMRDMAKRPIYVQTSLQVEGKEFAKIVGNEPTTLGTHQQKYAYQMS